MDNKEKSSLIKNLVEIFNKSDLDSLEFKDGDLEIKLKKRFPEGAHLETPRFNTVTEQPLQKLPNNIKAPKLDKLESSTSKVMDYSEHEGIVKSPTVGIIYTRPQPNEDTFVSVGSTVKEGDTLFLLEVMKVFSPIKAHKSGIIKEIFIKENDIVEYNEILAVIE